MTRKDYILIAAAIANAGVSVTDINEPQYQHGIEDTTHAIADALARDNPRFDCERFLKACGVQC